MRNSFGGLIDVRACRPWTIAAKWHLSAVVVILSCQRADQRHRARSKTRILTAINGRLACCSAKTSSHPSRNRLANLYEVLRKGNSFVVALRYHSHLILELPSMRLIPVVIAVTVALLCTHHASAFSMDSSGPAASDGSSGYTDPDEMLGGKDDAEHSLGYDPNSRCRTQRAHVVDIIECART